MNYSIHLGSDFHLPLPGSIQNEETCGNKTGISELLLCNKNKHVFVIIYQYKHKTHFLSTKFSWLPTQFDMSQIIYLSSTNHTCLIPYAISNHLLFVSAKFVTRPYFPIIYIKFGCKSSPFLPPSLCVCLCVRHICLVCMNTALKKYHFYAAHYIITGCVNVLSHCLRGMLSSSSSFSIDFVLI